MAARKSETKAKKATKRSKKTGGNGRSPINGSIPPEEYRFSSTNQPKRRGGPAVNFSKVAEAIRDAAQQKIVRRYTQKRLDAIQEMLDLTDEEMAELTVAETVALVAEQKAMEGDFRFWDRFVERNEGKVADKQEVSIVEPTSTEDARESLDAAIGRHAGDGDEDEAGS